MNALAITCFAAALLGTAILVHAQEPPTLPAKEHAWLKQLAGEWESEGEMFMEPGQAPVKAKSQEVARMLGGFWLVADGTGEMMGMTMSSRLTLGYDPDKKKYIGTWVDSMTSYLWRYEGTLDATGKKLTLETEGPCPIKPGTTCKFKEVVEIKDKDHKVFTSNFQGEDGKWTTLMVVHSKRKK